MLADPQDQRINVEVYFELDQADGIRHEYLDGYVYVMSGGTIAHARITFNMAKLLDAQLIEGSCHVHTSDVHVQLSAKRYVYPDVTVNCDHGADYLGQETTIRSPRLVVEVLSPSTEAYDRGKKFVCYQQCPTIQEYVLVNTRYQSVEVFRRQDASWSYRRFGPGQNVELESLNIQFPLAALYERVTVPLEEEDESS